VSFVWSVVNWKGTRKAIPNLKSFSVSFGDPGSNFVNFVHFVVKNLLLYSTLFETSFKAMIVSVDFGVKDHLGGGQNFSGEYYG